MFAAAVLERRIVFIAEELRYYPLLGILKHTHTLSSTNVVLVWFLSDCDS